MKHLVQKQLAQSIATMQAVLADETISETLVTVAKLTAKAMESGHKLLAPAAEQAVHQWRFATAPDSTVMNIEVVFANTGH